MKEVKKIDRLFQEKFKDFEAVPPLDAWKNIEAKLDEKKRRRVIPFWYKLSGVAALFLIGLFLGKEVFLSDGIDLKNDVINSNTTTESNSNTEKEKTIKIKNKIDGEVVVGSDQNNSAEAHKESILNTENNHNSNYKNSSFKSNKTNNTLKNNTVVGTISNKNRKTKDKTLFTVTDEVSNNSKTSVVSAVKEPSKSNNDKEQESLKKLTRNQIVAERKSKIDAENSKPKDILINEKSENNSSNELNTESIVAIPEKKSSNNAELIKTIDSLTEKKVVKNELEELLKEKESNKQKNSKENRWQLASTVAPVFLGSVSNGSPIDPVFENNQKSYNTTLSYGIGVGYSLSKKVTIRSGINKLLMSYNTYDVAFTSSINSTARMQNINPSLPATAIELHSINSLISSVNAPTEDGLLAFEVALVQENQGYLKQQIGFLELPFEMTYALVNKKLGVDFIGGFSTLFLQENNISLVTQNQNILFGEANNINSLHFSTNIGFGVKYKIYRAFEVNIEPMFKYQLNTFSSNNGNFRPYVFGVYSGLRYNF